MTTALVKGTPATDPPVPLPVPSPGPRAVPLPRPDPSPGRRQILLRLVCALAAGGCLALSFPPVGVWPLGFLGAGLLPLSVRRTRPRTAFALATLAGMAYFVPVLAFTRFPGVDAWLGLSVLEAFILGAAGPAFAAVQRLPGGPAWCAAVWVGDEALRGRAPFGGFPWARLGFAQVDEPAVRWAALAGAPLVSLVVALSGCLLIGAAWSVVSRGRRLTLAAIVSLGVAVVLPAAGLLVRVPTAGEADAQGRSTLTVAVIQGNVPRLGLGFDAQRRAVLDNHVAQTLAFAAAVHAGTARRPDVVIWPENSSDIDPFASPDGAALLTKAAMAVGSPILVGAVLDAGPGKVANTGLVWTSAGPTGVRYVKRHPVPFGEYVPYRAELTALVGRLGSDIPNDFIKGTATGALRIGPTTVGDVICFEVAYDGIVRSAVNDGGRLLAVQTNNATFGFSSEAAQQLQMARLRAIEHGRAAVVASTTGISAVIQPDGRVTARTRIFTSAALEAVLPLRSSRTVADRLGAWPECLIVVLALTGWLASSRRPARRGARRGGRREARRGAREARQGGRREARRGGRREARRGARRGAAPHESTSPA